MYVSLFHSDQYSFIFRYGFNIQQAGGQSRSHYKCMVYTRQQVYNYFLKADTNNTGRLLIIWKWTDNCEHDRENFASVLLTMLIIIIYYIY